MSDVGVLRPGIAIPTKFRGIMYRSRLEANVAQFLTDLGTTFEYETQSFLVNGDHYAPDFYLPQIDRFVEARGYLTEDSEATLEEFAKQQGELFVFYSDRAEQISYSVHFGGILRSGLSVCLCSDNHTSTGTLGHRTGSHPCWLCSLFGRQGRPRVAFLDVVMRSGVPVLITDVGSDLQGLGRE